MQLAHFILALKTDVFFKFLDLFVIQKCIKFLYSISIHKFCTINNYLPFARKANCLHIALISMCYYSMFKNFPVVYCYSCIRNYQLIKFVSDLRQVGCFIWVLRFPPSIKLSTMITEILLIVALNTIKPIKPN